MNILSTPLLALRALLLVGFAMLGLSACGGGGGTPAAATLQSIEISPLNATLPAGTTQQFTAMAIFSNNSKVDVTGETSWSSSDVSTASISSSGLASAIKLGSATITGTYQGKAAATPLTVSAAVVRSVAVTPTNVSLGKGSSRQATATATFSDNSTRDVTSMAAWSSSAAAIATVGNASNNRGLVSAVNPGNASISASFQGVSGSTGVTVTAATLASIEVTPVSRTIAKGTTQQFAATGRYTDNSTQNLTAAVTWGSSSTAVASISNAASTKGRASGLAVGTTTISAVFSGVTGSTNLTVSAATLTALQVTPATASRPKGVVQQFTATGTFTDQSTQDLTAMVVWSSSNTAIATISNAAGSNGQATGVSEGAVTITAASGATSSTASLTVTAAVLSRIDVTPAQPSIPVGTTQQFTATGVFTDSTTQDFTSTATWSSTSSSVLEISNSDGQRGLAVGNQQGTATVSASSMGVTGSTEATVSAAALTAIQVTPANATLAKGFSLQYTATGTFSDNTSRDITTQVSWAVGNASFASISNADGSQGLATATTVPGSTTISATLGSLAGSTGLTVTNATLTSVAVTPANSSAPKGVSRQLTATGTFSDSSTQNLTEQASWSSSAAASVTVSNSAGTKGLAMAVDTGSATVTASVQNAVATTPVNGSTMLTVTAAALTGITITPGSVSLADGTRQQFSAQGTYSDSTSADITTTVTWASSSAAVATISNAAGTRGLATAESLGQATITAALSGVTSNASSVTVTSATLVSIDVTPKTPSVAAGRSQQFTAVGTYTDGSTQTLTSSVTWSSDTTAVATISNTSESAGLASSTTKGSTKIKAASADISSADVTLTVTDAVPVSLSLSPANQTIGNNSTLQFTATETFSDGSTSDQTAAVTWSSSNTAAVDISNAAGSKGLATAKTQGMVTITATDASVTPNITANTSLTVGAAALQRITVSGQPSTLPAGYRVQYSAIGTYADGTTQNITSSANWSTVTTAVATVNNTAGSKGVVTTVAPGTTSVLASLNGITGNGSITVSNATLSAIVVTPDEASVGGGDTLQYTATANFSDGSTLDITRQVTWASSTTTAATIDQNGLATGATGGTSVFGGDTTISASRNTPTVTGEATLTRDPGP